MTQKNFINLKSWLTIAAFLVTWVTHAQSIVNPSFETYSSCPTSWSQTTRATGWSQPTGGTSDYYNGPSPCNYRISVYNGSDYNEIPAHEGTGYAGGVMEARASASNGNYKEYITSKLSAKLVAGTTYAISFWTLHLYDPSYVDLPIAEQGYLGLAFTAVPPTSGNTSINQTSSSIPGSGGVLNSWNPNKRTTVPASNTSVYGADSRNTWVPVTLLYTADGTEEYMTVGQWREDPTSLPAFSTTYYVFDGFSMTEVPSASLTKAVSPATITDGDMATYTFTISNTESGSVELPGVRFTDTLPSGLRIANNPNVVVTGLTGGTTTATAGGTSVVADNYTIAANTTATITVDVTNAPGQLNASCGSNPAAFTNSAANISNMNGLINNVGNVCLTVEEAPIVMPGCNYTGGSTLGMADPVQGLWESLIMKSSNGDFLVTGRTAHGNGSTNLTTFTNVVNGSNGYSFTGTPLMMTGASTASTVSHQYFLLTTTGLYKWGGTTVVTGGSSAMTSFALPTELAVGNIQMMDAGRNGTIGSLMILTKQGEIWVYSNNAGNNVHGDGNASGSNIWHKVMTSAGVPLTGMKDVRTMGQVAVATDGYNIYTWGTGVYLGDGNAPQNKSYATLMTNPTGIALPILQQDLGGNSPSYYLRDSNGKVFTMGDNGAGKLGLGHTNEMRSWGEIEFLNEEPGDPGNQAEVTIPVKKVIWISANNHTSGSDTQFNLITEDNINYAAGSNNLDKQGVVIGPTGVDLPTPTAVTTNNGANKLPGKMVFVESGGKTSILIKEGTGGYGFVGEATNGGDGCPSCPYRPREYIFATPAIDPACGGDALPIGRVLWYKADKGVNTFTDVPAADNTQLTTWFDQATLNGSQDGGAAAVHPATPLETDLPSLPYYKYNNSDNFNFNPVVHFDATNNGQAVQFTTPAKGSQTIFTVFKSPGTPSENTFYTSQLLYGGDVVKTNPTDGDAAIKSDLTLAVRSQSRLVAGGGSNGDFAFYGDIMLNNTPSIGTLKRDRASQEEVYMSMYADGSTELSNQNADPANTLTGEGRDLINSLRIGKTFSAYQSGLSSPKGKLDGDVAEVIVYDEVLSDEERAKVETYLAVKYGITLTGGTKQFGATVGNADYDYVNSDGTVIRASDATYKYDVFGLGRDDYFGLNQRITRSKNANDILTVSTNDNFNTLNLDGSRTAIDGDQEYMLFANNKGSSSVVTTQTTELPSGIATRLDREWKTALANTDGTDISDVSLNFNLSGITLAGANASNLKLLIDTDGDGDFTTGTIEMIDPASFTAGSNVRFDNISFTNGQVFTLGITSLSCTKPAATGTALTSSVGILTKGSPSVTNWPVSVPNGYLVLDAVAKGMVITHMTTDQINALTPVEGMLVYDTDTQCVKLYRGTAPTLNPTQQGWVCIERVCID